MLSQDTHLLVKHKLTNIQINKPKGRHHTYQSLVDLARVWPPLLAIAIDGATAIDGKLVDASEHDPVPPVLVAPVRPVRRRHQRSLDRESNAGLARALESDKLEQVVPAVWDEHDGRSWRGARRLPRPGQRLRVVVAPIATGAVAVDAEHALRRRRRQRPAPGSGGGSIGARAVQVVCAVSRVVIARSCSLKSAGHEERREERHHEHKLHQLPAGCHCQSYARALCRW